MAAAKKLIKPIAVFDAGIGSYAIVDLIRRKQPKRDILYFADRASFPYGSKTSEQLETIMRQTFRFLENYDPSAIIIASNAPSIMVFDRIREDCKVPLYGVFPPLKEAERLSKSGHVAICGVASMVNSEMGRTFVKANSKAPELVSLVNASVLVERVENGAFLFDKEGTQKAVDQFMDMLLRQDDKIDVVTLSSTHLPWLLSYFERAKPDIRFLDPAEAVVADLANVEESGTGQILALVSESADYGVDSFQEMLNKLDVNIKLHVVSPQ